MRRPVIVAAASVTVFALGLGGSAAADAFITGKDVKDGSLTGRDIKSGSLTGSDIETNSITWSDIANGTVRSTEIRNGSIELKDMSDKALEQLVQGILGTLQEIGVFDALDDLESADVALKADVADLKDDLTALAARVTTAEGTLADVVADAAAIDAKLTALDTRVDALEDKALISSNWGNILRNVLGSASTQLRNGPFAKNFNLDAKPPVGTGSLEINVMGQIPGTDPAVNNASKAAFGNEVDFVGDAVTSIGSPSFSVYTTGENNARGANNLPNIAIEIDPDVNNAAGNAINYTTMVFVPQGAANLGGWTKYTATEGQWYFTGAAGTATGCSLSAPCTFAAAMDALGDDGKIHSVGVSKGRDLEFHGAVDALTIGNKTYDFEARGVVARTAE